MNELFLLFLVDSKDVCISLTEANPLELCRTAHHISSWMALFMYMSEDD